jgi:phage-related protein
VILALAAAIALLGIGVLAIGGGLLMFSAGLTALAIAGTAGAAALVIVVTALLSLIPMALEKLGEGVIAFAGVITKGTPAIMEAVKAIALGIIQILTEVAPQVVDAVFTFVSLMLDKLIDNLPKFIDTGWKLLKGLLEGLEKNIKDVVAMALRIVGEFLKGVAEGIPDVVAGAVDVVVAFVRAIGEEVPRIVDAGFKMVVDLINGIADAVRDNTPLIFEAAGNLAGALIEGVVKGMIAGPKKIADSVINLGKSAIAGFKEVLGIASPSQVFYEFGENTVEGYVDGVEDSTPMAEEALKEMADAAINAAYESFDSDGTRSALFEQLAITNAESFVEGIQSMGSAIRDSFEQVFGGHEDVFEELMGVVDAAVDQIANRIEDYTNIATNRFSQMNTESTTSVEEMILNMKANQMAIADWADNIVELAKRGLDDGLLEELRQAGPKSAGEVKALVDASDDQLRELETVMAKGAEVATNALALTVKQGAPLMIEPGQSLVDAIAQGITSDTSVNDVMAWLMSDAHKIAMESFDQREYNKIGFLISEGLSDGILDNLPEVIKTLDMLGVKAGGAAVVNGEFIAEKAVEGILRNRDKYEKAGDSHGSDFTQALSNKQVDATTAGRKVTDSAEAGVKYNADAYGKTGDAYGTNFSNELSNKQGAANTAGKLVSSQALSGVQANQPEFGATGSQNGSNYSDGLSSQQNNAYYAGSSVGDSAEQGISSVSGRFFDAGYNAGQSFANGLQSARWLVEQAAGDLGGAAGGALENELGIFSPSRVFKAYGMNTGEGFIVGLRTMMSAVATSATDMGTAAIDSVKDVIKEIADLITSDMDSEPVIRPVLDLSDVERGTDAIASMLSGRRISVAGITSKAQTVAAQIPRGRDSGNVLEGQQRTGGEGAKYSFVQNNYSPKALTRLEIYRQTRNQFAQIREVVEGA